jgi:hypothetical protein
MVDSARRAWESSKSFIKLVNYISETNSSNNSNEELYKKIRSKIKLPIQQLRGLIREVKKNAGEICADAKNHKNSKEARYIMANLIRGYDEPGILDELLSLMRHTVEIEKSFNSGLGDHSKNKDEKNSAKKRIKRKIKISGEEDLGNPDFSFEFLA